MTNGRIDRQHVIQKNSLAWVSNSGEMFGLTLVQLFWKRLLIPLSLNIDICYFGTCITESTK